MSERPKDSLTAGDANDPKCLGFHSMKPRKVRGGSTSPLERAILFQAADKGFACGQELRWVSEGLYIMGGTQSATGFGGLFGNVAFPRKIMAD